MKATIACDTDCNATIEVRAEPYSIRNYTDELSDAGWHIEPTATGEEHYCPSCKPKGEADGA